MVEINDYCGKNYIKHSSTIGRFPWIEGKGLYLCKGPDYRNKRSNYKKVNRSSKLFNQQSV